MFHDVLQLIADNKIDDVETVLSHHQPDATTSLQQLLKLDSTRCSERCCCQKCLQLIHNAATSGQVSSLQTCTSVIETNGCVPSSRSCREMNGHVPLADDTKAQVPSCTTTPMKWQCHPLCCCEQCSQLVSSEPVHTSPNVYCRNDRGLSGQCCETVSRVLLSS